MTYFFHILPNSSSFRVVLLFEVTEMVFLRKCFMIKKTISMSGIGEHFLFMSLALEYVLTYLLRGEESFLRS